MKKRRIRFLFSTIGLLAVVISAPVAVAAILIHAASSVTRPADVFPASKPADSTAAATRAAPAAPDNPLVTGMLYTNGPVKVDWQGVNIPVESSSYVYTGGELISTSSAGMGILQLGSGGGTVFICPGSKVRLSREAGGEFKVDVVEGKSRFVFPAGTPFQVRVNDTVLSPDHASPPPDSAQPTVIAGEVESTKDGGCLLCGLKNKLTVAGPGGASGGGAVSALAGQIVTVPGAGAGTAPTTLDIPDNLRTTLQAGLGAAGGGAGFLCKCGELKDYTLKVAELLAREAADLAAQGAEGQAPGLITAAVTPPDPAPPVAPPQLPDFIVENTGAPDPFVPGLLPAAGEQGTAESSAEPVVIVPPPLVPGSGTGGGGVVSPS